MSSGPKHGAPHYDRAGYAWIDFAEQHGRPLRNADDLEPLVRAIGDARYVLIGEASHGTSEFYRWRQSLSERLIREKDFSFIAVEGDWPDCQRVNRYVKGHVDSPHSARRVMEAFERWPTWMWANQEVLAFHEWLRDFNADEGRAVGFYGFDVYSLWDSLHRIHDYLQRVDKPSIEFMEKVRGCFDPFGEDIHRYAEAAGLLSVSCEEDVVALLARIQQNRSKYLGTGDGDAEAFFDAEQNALVARNAEHYYRTMMRRGPASWNLRDNHMVETLERLMKFHGPEAKSIVWAHNTHVGDARATDMARGGMLNVGQLVRDRHGDEGVYVVGFSSHRGSVIAADAWEAPMERIEVPPARAGSFEDLMHQSGAEDKLLIFEPARHDPLLLRPHGHRAIGVVYHPEYESYGNYAPSIMPLRYDAMLYVDRSHALHPLHMRPLEAPEEIPETFPYGE